MSWDAAPPTVKRRENDYFIHGPLEAVLEDAADHDSTLVQRATHPLQDVALRRQVQRQVQLLILHAVQRLLLQVRQRQSSPHVGRERSLQHHVVLQLVPRRRGEELRESAVVVHASDPRHVLARTPTHLLHAIALQPVARAVPKGVVDHLHAVALERYGRGGRVAVKVERLTPVLLACA